MSCIDINPLIGYTNPSTGEPSFDGNVVFIVTSAQLPGYGYFNLSSVPTSTPSSSWQKAAAAWWANHTISPPPPVDSISAVVCSSDYSIEPWTVDLVNNSIKLVERQSQPVGNLNRTQLNIAIQDCFTQLPFAFPKNYQYDESLLQILMLLTLPNNEMLPAMPRTSQNLSSLFNIGIPASIQAYLDDFPFGNFTPSDSNLLTPALVLSAELHFIYAIAFLYAFLSGLLCYLFLRPTAEPFTIQSVLSITCEAAIPNTHGISRGLAVAANIEQIDATNGKDVDDSAREALIANSVSNHHVLARRDLGTRYAVLEIDSAQDIVVRNMLIARYDNSWTRRSRITWVFTPAFGAALVAFGIATWRHHHVVSYSPQSTNATLFSALFTWALGLWRTLSLVAVAGLIRKANSEVGGLSGNPCFLQPTDLLQFLGMGPPAQEPRAAWLEPEVTRNF